MRYFRFLIFDCRFAELKRRWALRPYDLRSFRGLELPGGDRLSLFEILIVAVLGLMIGLLFWISVLAVSFEGPTQPTPEASAGTADSTDLQGYIYGGQAKGKE